MYERKSSHESSVGRHKVSCYTDSEASVAGIGSVGATGVGGVISSGVEETIARVTGCRKSTGDGGSHGSPYDHQIDHQISLGKCVN